MNTLEDLTGGTSAIPELGNLSSLLGIITVVSIVLSVLFVGLYVASMVQRMRSERAMIAMHKDIAAIKDILEKKFATPTQPAPEAPAATMPEPMAPAPTAPVEQ